MAVTNGYKSYKMFACVAIVACLMSLTVVDCLKVAAFNIQVFGRSKASKAGVMGTLVRIISRYDLVLIQEIRDSSGEAIQELLQQTNARNGKRPFMMKLSDRLGRTSSKEQYAFFYRPDAGLTPVRDYIYDDGDESMNTNVTTVDTFQREPYVVLFESTTTVMKKFAVAGIHVDPDEAVEEITALSDVFDDIRSKLGVSDIVVMGDLNADCSYVPASRWKDIPLKHDTKYTWLIGDQEDTTVSGTECAYDRFIVTGSGFSSAVDGGLIPDSATVFHFDMVYNMDQETALQVSDHYPIELELVDITSGASATYCAIVTLLLFVCLLQIL